MLKRILIANRGEIAARIAKTCRQLAIEYVAVYSDADSNAPYLRGAAASVHLGASLATESYLNQSKIIAAAIAEGCDSIHPGYGFLSENATFARAVEEAGLIFIGPRADTIECLGDKARAKVLMQKAGVPTVPGTVEATEAVDVIIAKTLEMGFPVLLKPTAGGGGKGMQIVRAEPELREAAEQAIRLARANFKDGALLVEKYIENPRHIEVQVFGDQHGNAVHLFERECSLQRRHQKVVEEAPAASISQATAMHLRESAVRGAQAVGYVNAGTFEFIVDSNGEIYFLEVNTRLQVEHPVTEEITGLDLVEWQIRVASGESLPLAQSQIHQQRHAIECRVYAEDASNDFRPAPGTVIRLEWPSDTRVDAAIEAGNEISPFYDPMIAKLIVKGADRAAALVAMQRAVAETVILGITTNLGFLGKILSDPAVSANDIHTRYLDQNLSRYNQNTGRAAAAACAAAIALPYRTASDDALSSPWIASTPKAAFDRVTLDPSGVLGRVAYWAHGDLLNVAIQNYSAEIGARIVCEGEEFVVTMVSCEGGLFRGLLNGQPWSAMQVDGNLEVLAAGDRVVLEPYISRCGSDGVSAGTATAPMPGVVVVVEVTAGDVVTQGTTLVVVEAMKMENRVMAHCDGTVTAVHCRVGDNVGVGAVLVELEPA